MAFSEMNSRDRTIIIILVAVIVLALIGIGLLVARLLSDGALRDEAGGITVVPTSEPGAVGQVEIEPTITAVAAPALGQAAEVPKVEVGEQPVPIVRQEAVGPLAPVLIVGQSLQPGHLYRIEISNSDGSQAAMEGNWSQSATSASGQVAAPQIEFFDGVTPYVIEVAPPVADPQMWSLSVSAGFKKVGVLSGTSKLVITILDVTGSQ